MGRGRKQQRKPHPDPGTELKLQRILDLRAGITRRENLIADYRNDIEQFHETARCHDTNTELIEAYTKRADELADMIDGLEKEIERVGGMIADLQAEISPDDLAWL